MSTFFTKKRTVNDVVKGIITLQVELEAIADLRATECNELEKELEVASAEMLRAERIADNVKRLLGE